MAIKTVITCDVCGVDKKDVNHWWSVWIADASFHSRPGVTKEGSRHVQIKQVCGVEHALTLFNRFLNHGTLEMEAVKPPEPIPPLYVQPPLYPPVALPMKEDMDLPF